jgi:hypothetical protein
MSILTTRKKWAVGICAAGVVAATVGATGIASAAAGTGSPGKGQPAFTVYTHMIEAHVVAPCAGCATPPLPAGSKVATWYVNDPVFGQAAGGQQIGQEALVINVVSSDASTALLSGALRFTAGGRTGELTVTGEIDPRASSGVVAVTGGTGMFSGATGEVNYSGAGLTSTETTLTVHLTSP